jgi:FKBP-type peptidyl-prolyl cis-trans isomerase (trigger factor)
MDQNSYTLIKTSEPKNSTVELEVEISAEMLEEHRKRAVREHSAHVRMPGFRAGHVPADIAEKNLDPQHILEDAAQDALNAAYPGILEQSGVAAESAPRVKLPKLEKGQPFTATVSVAVRPDVKLADYRDIAKKAKKEREATAVSDEDVQKAIDSIREMHKKEDGTLPELTKEFLSAFGDFADEAAFRKYVRETLEKEQAQAARQKQLGTVSAELLKKSKIAMSPLSIEDELQAAVQGLQHDLAASKMTIDQYLERIKKTEKELVEEMRTSAEDRLKMKYIFAAIAEQEKVVPDEEVVAKEKAHMLSHYKNASPERAEAYVRELITNNQIIDLLEKAEF